MALVESGVPSDVSAFDSVKVGELSVYVPRGKNFTDGIPRIVDFPRTANFRGIGVPNVER